LGHYWGNGHLAAAHSCSDLLFRYLSRLFL